MDIPSLSISLSGSKVSQSAGILLTKMAKEQMEQSGEQMVEMLDTAVIPTNSTIDIKL